MNIAIVPIRTISFNFTRLWRIVCSACMWCRENSSHYFEKATKLICPFKELPSRVTSDAAQSRVEAEIALSIALRSAGVAFSFSRQLKTRLLVHTSHVAVLRRDSAFALRYLLDPSKGRGVAPDIS